MADRSWSPSGVNLKELRDEEKELDRRLRIVRKLLEALDSGDVSAIRRQRRPRTNTRLAQIVGVLKAEGRPLGIREIYKRMQDQDKSGTLRWKQPAAAFRSYLREQPEGPNEVVRCSTGIYGLKQWQSSPPEQSQDEKGDSAHTGLVGEP